MELELVRDEEVMGDSGVGEKYESLTKRSAGDVKACSPRVLNESCGWLAKAPGGMRGGWARDCAAALGGGPAESLVVLLERSDDEDALRLCEKSPLPLGYG